jgi:hypothetical protein
MSSRRAGARETPPSDVHAGRIQRKYAFLLSRADARESALKSALAHARTAETQLRVQLDGERRRHAIESRLLRDRLRRLEQCLLNYLAAGRGALQSPLAAALRGSSGLLGAGLPSLPALASRPALAPGAGSTAAPGASAFPPQTSARAPFDPVATVASLLPLSQAHAGAPEADVEGALSRLHAVLLSTGVHDLDSLPTISHQLALDATTSAAAQTPAEHAELAPGSGPEERRPAEERPEGSDAPWFPRAFRRLAEEDSEAAGRLFQQLLPAQGLVWPEDVAYRIEVAETGTLAVEVRAGRSTVQPLLESERPARAGEPTLRADLAGLARAVAGRRGWSRVSGRIAGSRNRHLRPLRALAAAPLELGDLKRTGARPDPVLLLRLLALAIDPAWTAEEIFTVAFRWRGRTQRSCYIHIFENAPVAVTSAPPLGNVAATLTCAPEDLLEILLGEIPLGSERAQLGGERAALTSLLEWFQRVDATATTIPAETLGVAA